MVIFNGNDKNGVCCFLFFVAVIGFVFSCASGAVLQGDGTPNPSEPALQTWLAADAISGLVDGDSVQSWPDSSDKSNDATAAGPSRAPEYVTDAIAGFAAVGFDSTNSERMYVDGIASAFVDTTTTGIGDNKFTMFFVLRLGTLTDHSCYFSAGTSTSSYGFVNCYVRKDAPHETALEAYADDGQGRADLGSGITDDWRLLTLVSDGYDLRLYLDGSDTHDARIALNGVPAKVWANVDQATLGSFRRSSEKYIWDGYISEVLVYDVNLGASDIDALEGYFSTKYGNFPVSADGTVALPDGSPNPSYTALQTWLKADAISGLGNGDSVETWPDSSSKSNDASAASTTRAPEYVTFAVMEHPAVRFDSANSERMYVDDIAPTFIDTDTTGTGENEFTMFFVLQLGTLPDHACYFSAGTSTSSYGFVNCYVRNGTNETALEAYADGGQGNSDVGSELDSDWYLLTLVSDGYDLRLYLDGSDTYDARIALNGVPAKVWADVDQATLGAFRRATEKYMWDGAIAEVIIYDETVSAADIDIVEAYLYDKYLAPRPCGGFGTVYFDEDINRDCYVDFFDFAEMAKDWLKCTDPTNATCNP